MRRRQSSTPQGPEEQTLTYPIVSGPSNTAVVTSGPNAPIPIVTTNNSEVNNQSHENGTWSSLASDPPLPPPPQLPAPAGPTTKPIVIQPPIPPQHVYAPMPALGALSIGFLSRKNKKKEDDDNFKLLHGKFEVSFRPLLVLHSGLSQIKSL